MKLRQQILTVADAYCSGANLSRARVSTIVFQQGQKIDEIDKGRDITTRTFERAMEWFSENWPAKSDWPDGIDRPRRKAA